MAGSADNEIRGLVVKPDWLDKILDGSKSWEIRGSRTRRRGRIHLIGSGTGLVFGSVRLVDVVGPLTSAELFRQRARHQDLAFRARQSPPYEATFAWVLEGPRRFAQPIPYRHPLGAVIWVNLADIREQLIAASAGAR